MKKFYSLVAVAVLAASSFAQTNLVQNPSFETGSLEPWQKGWSNSYTAPAVVNGDGHEGTYSAVYDNPTGATGFYQLVPIDADTEYILSFWYKAPEKKARIWSSFSDGKGGFPTYTDDPKTDPLRTYEAYLPAATVWTQHTVEFTSLADVVGLQLGLRSYKDAFVSFDDFSLVKKSDLAIGEVVKSKYTLVSNTLVDANISFAADSKVEIFTMNGQLVKTADVKKGSTLNVSNLSKGIYIVNGTVNGNKVSQKIVKK